MIAYVWLLLLAYDRLTGVRRVELSRVMSVNHLHQQYEASSHFDHIPLLPSFYALVSTLKHCMSRLLTCGFWEVVDEVGTYCPAFKTWELLLHYAYTDMLCS